MPRHDFNGLKILAQHLEPPDGGIIPIASVTGVTSREERATLPEAWGPNPVQWALRPVFHLIMRLVAPEAHARDARARRDEWRRFRVIAATADGGDRELYRGFGASGERMSNAVRDAVEAAVASKSAQTSDNGSPTTLV